jgi:hypothetical protein
MEKSGKIGRRVGPEQSVAGDQPILCLAPITRPGETDHERIPVTFVNGKVVEIEAWTPEIAAVIAEEEAGQSVVGVEPTEG